MPSRIGLFDHLIEPSISLDDEISLSPGAATAPATPPGALGYGFLSDMPKLRTGVFDDLLAGYAGERSDLPRDPQGQGAIPGMLDGVQPGDRSRRTGLFDHLIAPSVSLDDGASRSPDAAMTTAPEVFEPVFSNNLPKLRTKVFDDLLREYAEAARVGPGMRRDMEMSGPSSGSDPVSGGGMDLPTLRLLTSLPEEALRSSHIPEYFPGRDLQSSTLEQAQPPGQGFVRNSAGSLVQGAVNDAFYSGAGGLARAGSHILADAAGANEGKTNEELLWDVAAKKATLERPAVPVGPQGLYGDVMGIGLSPAGGVEAEVDREAIADMERILETRARGGDVTRTRQGINGMLDYGAESLRQYDLSTDDVREAVEKFALVDPEFAQSTTGQVVRGVGQLIGTVPQFAVPGLPVVMGTGSAYDQQYRDAIAHGATEAEAHRAGLIGAPSGLLDFMSDRFLVGKFFKPMVGKLKVKDVIQRALIGAPFEGATESTQQLWNNVVARYFSKYDPERPLTEDMWQNFVVGSIVGGGAPVVVDGARAALTPESFEEKVNRAAAKAEAAPPHFDPERPSSGIVIATDPTSADPAPSSETKPAEARSAPHPDQQYTGEWDGVDSATTPDFNSNPGGQTSASPQRSEDRAALPPPTPPTAEERAETSARAALWFRMQKALAPAAAIHLGLKIQSKARAAAEMNTQVPEEALGAQYRNTIYLFDEALRAFRKADNERTAGVRLLQHEIAHAWWDTLSPAQQEALTRLWEAERTRKIGPLYEHGKLRSEVMDGTETDVQEWLSERVVHANEAWAQKKAEIADHDGSPISRVSAGLRSWLHDGMTAIRPGQRDIIADEFRRAMRRKTTFGVQPKQFDYLHEDAFISKWDHRADEVRWAKARKVATPHEVVAASKSAASNNQAVFTEIAFSPEDKAKLEAQVGFSLPVEHRYFDSYGVSHTRKRHGDLSKDPHPVADKDFDNIAEILRAPGVAGYAGKNPVGRDTILHVRKYGDWFYTLEEIREGRRALVIQTIRKAPARTSGAEALSPTSETLSRMAQERLATALADFKGRHVSRWKKEQGAIESPRSNEGTLSKDERPSGEVRFAKPRRGMRLSEVGEDFPVDDVAPKLASTNVPDRIGTTAAMALAAMPERVRTPNNVEVLIHNTESGSLLNRGRHLVTTHGDWDKKKAAWVPAIAETLKHAAIVLDDPEKKTKIYVRAYRGRQMHFVVITRDRLVQSHGVFTGKLITQFPEGSGRQQNLYIDWVRPESAQKPPTDR